MTTMMKIAGGSQKFAHECHLQEFIKQSQEYQALDENGLNQIYKLLMYNGMLGSMQSHPFPVERLHYLQDWAKSTEYQQIHQGNYARTSDNAVNINTEVSDAEAERLRNQIEELQREIERIKKK
jgi:hypothetical protein